jgi:hypothetical protein
MKNKFQLTLIILISLVFLFKCTHEKQNEVTEPPTSEFNNPYNYIGEGHNIICEEFLATHENFDPSIDSETIAKMSKDYLIAKGRFSDLNNTPDSFFNNLSIFVNFNSNNLNKVTDSNWLDSLTTNLVDQGALSYERKEKTLELIDVILGAEGDTNIVNEYCANLPSSIDDTTKTQILITAAVYNASYRLWIGDNLGKNKKGQKIQMTILGQDAVGAAIGSILYIGHYTLQYDPSQIDTNWDWEEFGWSALSWGIGASLGYRP